MKIITKTAIDRVKLARDPKRPHLGDFIKYLCSDFEELHGDRLVNDDRGLIGGFATIGTDGASGGPEPLPKDQHLLLANHSEPADQPAIIIDEPIAMKFLEIGAEVLDEIKEVGTLRVPRQLHAIHRRFLRHDQNPQ